MAKKWTSEEVAEQFGPLKIINREREQQLLDEGKGNHILSLIESSISYNEVPDTDRPSKKELEDMGYSEETYSRSYFEAFVGRRIVNCYEIYESAKPMPLDLEIDDDGINFSETALPSP